MSIHLRLSEVIRKSELNAEIFAKRVGVARSTLMDYKSGKRAPQFDFLERVCDEFSVDREWFYLGEGASGALRAVDEHWLREAIELIETLLTNLGRTLPPGDKARSIISAYKILVVQGESGKAPVKEFLKLVVSR